MREDYQYSTAEIVKLYGITNKGLEFYEKKGIIAPRRAPNGKYRTYGLDDCYHMYESKLYRRCGFSVDETMELIGCMDERAVREKLLAQKHSIDHQLALQARISFHMERIARLLQNLKERVGRYTIGEMPAMYRLFVRKWAVPHTSTEAESNEFALWNSLVPVNAASLRFPMRELLDGAELIHTDIGNTILAEDFELLGLAQSGRVAYLPPQRCVLSVVCSDPLDLGTPEWTRAGLNYLQGNGLALCHDPITRFIGIFDTPEGKRRYDEIWFPV